MRKDSNDKILGVIRNFNSSLIKMKAFFSIIAMCMCSAWERLSAWACTVSCLHWVHIYRLLRLIMLMIIFSHGLLKMP